MVESSIGAGDDIYDNGSTAVMGMSIAIAIQSIHKEVSGLNGPHVQVYLCKVKEEK